MCTSTWKQTVRHDVLHMSIINHTGISLTHVHWMATPQYLSGEPICRASVLLQHSAKHSYLKHYTKELNIDRVMILWLNTFLCWTIDSIGTTCYLWLNMSWHGIAYHDDNWHLIDTWNPPMWVFRWIPFTSTSKSLGFEAKLSGWGSHKCE